MRTYENDVARRLGRGEKVYYAVLPIYNIHFRSTIPKAVSLVIASESGVTPAYIPNCRK